MVERLLVLRNNNFDDGIGKDNRMTENPSFTTDDEESLPPNDSKQQLEENFDPAIVDGISPSNLLKLSILSVHSPSIDTLNDQDSIAGDAPAEKVKKKRRRQTGQGGNGELRKSTLRSRPWYTRIDLTKPLLFVTFTFLVYLMWIKKDVWIPRLLTSNTRIRHTASVVEGKAKEKVDSSASSSSSSSKEPSVTSSNQEDHLDNNNKDDNNIINDKISVMDDEEPAVPSAKSGTQSKVNLRTRRNKMSFGQERPKKRRRHLRNHVVDDDDDDDDDTNEVEVDQVDKDKPEKEPVLLSSIHSSKKHRHHRSDPNKEDLNTSKLSAVSVPNDDIVEQLRKLVKSQGRHRDFLSTFAKQTGLKKAKLDRFIQQKDFSVITLETLLSFLNSCDLTLLIVSK